MTATEYWKQEYSDIVGIQVDENGDIIEKVDLSILLENYHQAKLKLLGIANVVQQSEQYCECDKPTLGKSVSRCGTCNEWFKPLK